MQNTAVARIAAVREAAGPDIDIMIDAVNRLSPAEAIGVGRAFEPFNLFFSRTRSNRKIWISGAGLRSSTDSAGHG
jgi:hypothetical protein